MKSINEFRNFRFEMMELLKLTTCNFHSNQYIEAEYRALSYIVAETIWICKVLFDFGLCYVTSSVFIVATSVPLTCLSIQFSMIVANIFLLTIASLESGLLSAI